ncbi:hypothetical protein MLD38_002462 [Melastoma candidum]|uniref:Uncharacterized protein n=1 Tax=Melastoma candidum TaxID=119954 RepID=A0ACB9S0Q4_9MYRT|nr:hypothetical protein MLD38_002462 [Melastoma candidum]
MGRRTERDSDRPLETAALLPPLPPSSRKVPDDSFHFAYVIFFTLGAGFLLPWNAFITAVDYFSYLYPGESVDRVFAVVYMLVALVSLLAILFFLSSRKASSSDAYVRINLGLFLFVVSLLVVPVLDVGYIKGRTGLYDGFYVTVGAIALSAIADALVQGGIIGSAGEMPERYMQAVVAGTAASGVLISLLRVITKAVYPQDSEGLRKSANLYFAVGIVIMAVCMVFYNVADRLPVIKYYKELKMQAVNEEKAEKGVAAWRLSLWSVVGRIKWHGLGIVLIYVVTLAIFPGYITEDVHSEILKDWYAVMLISAYNVFDLIGKSLTACYLLENAKIAIWCTVGRLFFFPLFYLCLHGPKFLSTEIPVTILTCLLGLTNGYLTSVFMILAPKVVELQHAETAGIVVVLFLVIGLATGSVVAWFWVI